MIYCLYMKHDVEILGVNADIAEGFLERARGLIARSRPGKGRGLLIPKCNAIHTFFMRYPIDAQFLDRNGNVVRAIRNIRPWRLFVWGGWRARSVLETAADCAENEATRE